MKVIGFGAALVDKQFLIKDDALINLGIEKGLMNLNSEEKQNELLIFLQDQNYDQISSCGGSATNSIYAAAALGTSSGFIGKVAQDEDGEIYKADLKDNNIEISNCITSSNGKTGNCIVLITPDAERTMNTYLGVSSETKFSEINFQQVSAANLLFMEAYVVTSPDTKDTAKKLIERCYESDIKIALSLSDPGIVAGFKDELKSWMNKKIDYIFCNIEEAKTFCDANEFDDLRNYAKTIFITNGVNPTIVLEENQTYEIPAYEAKAVDTNGAGDMFAGGVIHGLSEGWDNTESVKFGNFLASKGVAEIGPRLKKNKYIEYLKEFSKK
jgi:sugar/nucleoside kinase (ribokinase family)